MLNVDAETMSRQWVAVQRFGTYVGNQMSNDVDEVLRQILRVAKNKNMSQNRKIKNIDRIISESKISLYKGMAKDLRNVGNIVIKAEYAAGLTGKVPTITNKTLKKWLSGMPLADTGITTQALYASTFDSVKRQATGAVLLNSSGQTNKAATSERMRAIFMKMSRDIMMLSSTAVNLVSNQSKQLAYAKARKVDRVMWVSTFDHRTSPFCQDADGKVFSVSKGPRPPAHPNCRSTVVAIEKGVSINEFKKDMTPRAAVEAKSKEELDRLGLKTKGGKVRKPSRSDRSPLKGTTTNATSYESWIKQQPNYYQDKVLGNNAAKRLRNGESLSSVLRDTRSSIDFSSLEEALN